ncbi:MAG: hypothetical protein C4560_14575 [Nitrospiraceae bacterium]|nr:MAG: hypothetical protein C4560_14575 [Nitrospiraceae bacterium]
MNPHAIPDEVIFNLCTTVLPGFRKIMKNLEGVDHELSSHAFALHLMELGREQMSEVADPSEKDVELMTGYIESLDYDNAEKAFFTAFAGGCVLGLVIINELAREDFSRALRLIEDFTRKEF